MNPAIQSILRAAFAPVLFALLAVSVNENAAAQTVQVCSAASFPEHRGENPHNSDYHQEARNQRDTCNTGANVGGIISIPSPSITGAEQLCGTCQLQGVINLLGCFFYQVEGEIVRGRAVEYCGTESQCNAVGGTRLSGNRGTPTGEVCKCDAGNARIGGICVTGETAGDCETFEEYATTEDADRTEGACRPRVAGDCTAPNVEFVADTTNGGGTCECVSPNVEINGVCEIGLCGAGEIQSQVFGRLEEINGAIDETQYYEGGCVAEASCDVSRGFFILPSTNRHPACICLNGSNDVRLDPQNTPDDATDDVCDNDCPLDAVITREKCLCSDGISTSLCSAPENAEECSSVFTDGSQPIYDASEADKCRPRDQRECSANEEFTASANPADGGGSCVECEGHEFSTNGAACEECAVNRFRGMGASCEACQIANEVRGSEETACSCKDPHVSVGGECRLPTGNEECARVGDGSAPIFDAGEATNCRAPEAGAECPAGQVLTGGSCTACTAPLTANAARNACECADPNVEVGGECRLPTGNAECAQVGDGSAPIFDASEPTNCRAPEAGSECPTGQVLLAGASACSACTGLLTPNTNGDACECADPNVEVNGECQVEVSSCPGAHQRVVDNVCVECETDQHLVNGACVACDPNEVRAQEAAACTCPVFTETDGSCVPFTECSDPLDLNEDDNTCFCNSATHFEEAGGSCVAHTDCTREGANVIRNTDDNTCVCTDNFEGEAGSCAACVGEYESRNGADCACPQAESFDAGEGVCEASLDGTCTEPRDFYNPVTNSCECPTGQRPNADETACEAIPASSDGGSSNGAVIALVAVPAVLIGGYWLLGGFDHVDPTYNLDYSGENANLNWRGNAGFNLRHGGLHSYASAIQSNGDAVSYESGISFEADNFALTYAATESQSDYDFDLGAEIGYNLGVMEIAPTAAALLQYRTREETWNAETTTGVSAVWTAHRWIVRAQSDFAGDGRYSFSVTRSF